MVKTKTPAHQSKLYHELSDWYERVFACVFGGAPRIGRTIESLQIPPAARVLEVGVGTGLSLPAYPQHASVTGIDLSPQMLEQAQAKIALHGWDHIQVREMDALQLQFPDASFDYVMAFHVITVVPDSQQLMREMVRVCRPHGTIVIINHFRSPRRWLARAVDLLDPVTRRLGWSTRLSLSDALEGEPLRVEQCYKTSRTSLFTIVVATRDLDPQTREREPGPVRPVILRPRRLAAQVRG